MSIEQTVLSNILTNESYARKVVPFLKEAYNDLPEDDKVRYETLLDCEDPDLFSWFMRNGKPEDPEIARIVSIIIKHVRPD